MMNLDLMRDLSHSDVVVHFDVSFGRVARTFSLVEGMKTVQTTQS